MVRLAGKALNLQLNSHVFKNGPFLGCKEIYCSLSLFIASSWRINISLKRNFIHFPKIKNTVPKSNERETQKKAKSPPNLAIKDVLQGCGEEIYCSDLIVVFVEADLILETQFN